MLEALAVLCKDQEDAREQVLGMDTLPYVVRALNDERSSVRPLLRLFNLLH